MKTRSRSAWGFCLPMTRVSVPKYSRDAWVSRPGLLKDGYSIRLQEVTDVGFGRRDIVIERTPDMRVVLEAKIGDAEPTEKQLLMYASEHALWSQYERRAIVALTKVEIQEAKIHGTRLALDKHNISFHTVQWQEAHRCSSTIQADK